LRRVGILFDVNECRCIDGSVNKDQSKCFVERVECDASTSLNMLMKVLAKVKCGVSLKEVNVTRRENEVDCSLK
jgi:hypothetical protein